MKIAAVQFTAGVNWASHRATVIEMIRAAAQGAQFIATPENTSGINPDKEQQRREAVLEADHPAVADFAALARELKVHLLCGSLVLRPQAGADRLVNRSLLFAPDGAISARYDKIHLFDVDLHTGESHRESATMQPGTQAVTASIGPMQLGLSICYDLRFAALYRSLALAGAQVLAVPSAFTVPTGQAHWHVLLRARAIENAAYIVAPAQVGTHAGGRKTYGHALIVDPWGEVLADAGDQPGIIGAEISSERVRAVRAALPSLQHDRPFSAPRAGS
jgi:predicted amidohydrolase